MSKKKFKISIIKLTRFIIVSLLLIALLIAAVYFLVPGLRSSIKQKKCSHFYREGACIHCGQACEHIYENGACIICKQACEHVYKDNICSICGLSAKTLWPGTSTPESAYPLAEADDDYLVLVNKEYKMLESYEPQDLVEVDEYVSGVGDISQKTNCMRKIAAQMLNEMISDAKNDNIYIKLRTGYRSYSYQQKLFQSYAQSHGEALANTFSARAGESEHQTGLACDLGGKSENYALSDYFGDTQEGKWVRENCWRYGFILRYTDGSIDSPGEITGYIYEPWHIRYVGTEAAKIITENELTLEEYLAQIKEADK